MKEINVMQDIVTTALGMFKNFCAHRQDVKKGLNGDSVCIKLDCKYKMITCPKCKCECQNGSKENE